jgi:pimeloyl-ACP methyl ester carboxylesterase
MPMLHVPDCELHYQVVDITPPWSRGAQTILFHHGLGATSGSWAAWLPVLGERYRIVTFDMRGHGRSSHPPAGKPLSFERLVADLLAVADAVGAERFHLVGESIGGTIALQAAIEHAPRIRTLTISNGAHVGGSLNNLGDWQQRIEAGGMQGWSEHMMGCRFFNGALSDPMWQWYAREQASASADMVLRAVKLLAGADLSGRLGSVTMPVLLMHGDSSPFIPVPVMVDLKERLEDARLQVFAHARHGLPFSHARECAAVLRAFLDEAAARGGVQ